MGGRHLVHWNLKEVKDWTDTTWRMYRSEDLAFEKYVEEIEMDSFKSFVAAGHQLLGAAEKKRRGGAEKIQDFFGKYMDKCQALVTWATQLDAEREAKRVEAVLGNASTRDKREEHEAHTLAQRIL